MHTPKKKLNLMPFFALERLNCCTQEEKGKHQVKKAEKVHIYKLKQVNKKTELMGRKYLDIRCQCKFYSSWNFISFFMAE